MQEDNTYFLKNQEEATELSRLIGQSRAFNRAIGDQFPPSVDPARLGRVIDLGSGSGDWCLAGAEAYPHIQFTGYDISDHMVRYANAQANSRGLSNVGFRVANVLKSLDLEAGSVDLVNSRFSASYLHRDAWHPFLLACRGWLRTGGCLNVCEMDSAISNSAAWGQISSWMVQVGAAFGFGFGQGYSLGTVAVLPQLMKNAGLLDIQHTAYCIDWSVGTTDHDFLVESGLLIIQQIRPAILSVLNVQAEQFDSVIEQARLEASAPDFCTVGFILSVVGTAP
jgi:trans-aconitate methyltransferase